MKYTYNDVINSDGDNNSWWETIIINRFVYRLTWLFANYSKLSPNQITIISFLFGMISAYFFLYGNMILAAFLFEFSFIMDCIDGRIARIKGLGSKFGEFLDIITDIIKYFAIILCLIYGQYLLTKDVSIFIYGYIFLFLELLLLTGGYGIHLDNNKNSKKESNNIIYMKFPFMMKFKNYIDPKNRLSLIPLSATEAETIVFFISPILMKIQLGIILGSIILFLNILISIIFNLLIKNQIKGSIS